MNAPTFADFCLKGNEPGNGQVAGLAAG